MRAPSKASPLNIIIFGFSSRMNRTNALWAQGAAPGQKWPSEPTNIMPSLISRFSSKSVITLHLNPQIPYFSQQTYPLVFATLRMDWFGVPHNSP